MTGFAIDLNGRVAIVTGGGSGIGEATAKLLASAGAAVAIAGRSESSVNRVASEINASGGTAVAVVVDVSRRNEVDALVTTVRSELGPVRILVNNAAIAVAKPFGDTTQQEIEQMIHVNLFGVLNTSRAALTDLVAEPGGRIINIISDAARTGEPFLSAYAASKAGVVGFTKSLAKEIGSTRTTVNCVSPGTTLTPAAADFIQRVGEEKLARSYPLRRIGRPIDTAHAVLFFASALSDWITGQVLSVSGGYTMA